MKWIFLAGLLAFVPLLTAILRSRPQYLLHACFFMGLLLFFLNPYLYVAPISWNWIGPVKGLEVSILDAISVAVILATRPTRIPIALKIGLSIYLLALVISTAGAELWMPSAFYGWQLLRTILMFVAVARATAAIPHAPIALAAGLGTAIGLEALLAIKQFLGGNAQPGGTLGHRNMLGITSHFAVMPAFAILLAGRRNLLAVLVVLSGMAIALVGGSRATIGLFAIGLVVTTALSIRHKMTGRKGAFAAAAVALLALSAPAMMWAIERRSVEARISSNAERSAMIETARMIITDYPLGVGANRYVIVANLGGYSDRAGVTWQSTSRAAPVHNSYYLVAAEMGILGLAGLLTILASVIALGFKSIRRLNPSERSDLVIGFLAAIIVVCAHIAYEWLLVSFSIHYLLAMAMGTVVGVTAAQDRARALKRRGAAVPAPLLASQSM